VDFCGNNKHNTTRLAQRAAETDREKENKKDKARRRASITVAYTAYKCAVAKQLEPTPLY